MTVMYLLEKPENLRHLSPKLLEFLQKNCRGGGGGGGAYDLPLPVGIGLIICGAEHPKYLGFADDTEKTRKRRNP